MIVFFFFFFTNMSDVLLVFFFQAEDGIRDADVTGVQTCALPILPLQELYTGYARHDGSGGDGKHYLALQAGEIVTAVRVRGRPGLRCGYAKLRIRRSIEYPVAGVAVAVRKEAETLAD